MDMANTSNTTAPTEFIQTNLEKYAYRRLGKGNGLPLLCLQHFTGTLDNWDRIPIVQGPGEVLKTQERQTISFPKAAIGVLFEVGLDELRGCGSVACICHGYSFLPLW